MTWSLSPEIADEAKEEVRHRLPRSAGYIMVLYEQIGDEIKYEYRSSAANNTVLRGMLQAFMRTLPGE